MNRPRTTAVRVGLAGWSNPPGCRRLRAPEQTHLAYYGDQFNCVEINSSFYREHRPSTYREWRCATPRSFRFAVKMPRAITHEAALRGVRRKVRQFLETVEPLGDKLGAILIQLPPSLAFDARTAQAFFKLLPDLGKSFYACEPRHPSWFDPRADNLMARRGVARVAADPARVAGAEAPGGCPEHAYFRWHGSPRMYYSSYAPERLAPMAAQVAVLRARHPWCIFDNTARHAAWENACMFSAMLGKSTWRPTRGKKSV